MTAYSTPAYDRLLAANPSIGPTGHSTRMAQYAAHKATLTVGARVTVRYMIPGLGGRTGTVTVAGWPDDSGDFAVLLDGRAHPLSFYGYELALASQTKGSS